MSYDFAQERYEAWLEDQSDHEEEYLLQQCIDEDEEDARSARSPYRCVDRMCGALDCSNCHPGCDVEENEDA